MSCLICLRVNLNLLIGCFKNQVTLGTLVVQNAAVTLANTIWQAACAQKVPIDVRCVNEIIIS